MNIRISAVREMNDPRTVVAEDQPHRRHALDKLEPRLECPLGRLRLANKITEAEYNAGCQWRNIYHNWLRSIGAPNPFPAAIDFNSVNARQDPLSEVDDELAEAIARSMRVGERALKALGPRVFHATNAVAVYEETDDLGDFEFTARAAQKGLAALSEVFG